uniref:Uncharacterized protein n=1 Tax=Arundo donax TaxID=35708 RepID=A0A0A9F796_ARUDO
MCRLETFFFSSSGLSCLQHFLRAPTKLRLRWSSWLRHSRSCLLEPSFC